jgi:sigma-B regulation protein RsbU (phosphoserine phosphatase)
MACALQLSLPAVLDNLPRMLALVDTACASIGVPPEAAYDVRLAVDEMCTNVISHGYEGLPTGPMSLQLVEEPRQLVIRLSDRGHACPPDAVPEPDLAAPWDERPIGGLGWHLTRQVMDSISYETAPDGEHHLTLVKRFTPAGPAPHAPNV